MRIRALASAVLAGVLLLVVGGEPAAAATGQTTTNLTTATHDEALAYAEYYAWATQADAAGNPTVAALLRNTADQERGDHFAQLADSLDMVSSEFMNLYTGIVAENVEATSLYPGFAAQAAADGDTAAAAVFSDLASDEGQHHIVLEKVLKTYLLGGRWPALPGLSPVAIVPGPAQSSGQTLTNLNAALRGEAFASARYVLFSQAAYRNGRSTIGLFFLRLAGIELFEHFAQLANLAGLVAADVTTNLNAAIAAENGAIASYESWATAATGAGDTVEAALFTDIRGDEVVHQVAFTAALGG
jgi:rubrerythrin